MAKFAEHKITGLPRPPFGYFMGGDAYINDTFFASQSEPLTVVVQEEAIQPWPEAPLPTQFWTRPINEANRNWVSLAANWLAGAAQVYPAGAAGGATANFNYGTAPESPHIMWATPMWAGGIMDARFGDTSYQTSHYEGLSFTPPIILNGKIYYNVQSLHRYGWYCLDLYTGEVDYFHNTTEPMYAPSGAYSVSLYGQSPSFGQIYDYESPNQHGGMPYLWSTNSPPVMFAPVGAKWDMFDAFTGNYICSIGNTTQTERRGTRAITTGATGTAAYGKDGSILRYNIVNLHQNSTILTASVEHHSSYMVETCIGHYIC